MCDVRRTAVAEENERRQIIFMCGAPHQMDDAWQSSGWWFRVTRSSSAGQQWPWQWMAYWPNSHLSLIISANKSDWKSVAQVESRMSNGRKYLSRPMVGHRQQHQTIKPPTVWIVSIWWARYDRSLFQCFVSLEYHHYLWLCVQGMDGWHRTNNRIDLFGKLKIGYNQKR